MCKSHYLRLFGLIAFWLVVAGCQTIKPADPQLAPVEEAEALPAGKQQQLNWFLEMGSHALKADRLTTPTEDNAYTWYKRALAISPEDPSALKGMAMISERYQQFARKVAEQGLIAKAEQYLDKAKLAAKDHSSLSSTEAFIAIMSESDIRTYRLAPEAVAKKASAIKDKLYSIGSHAFEMKAKVLIVARNDQEGRWMYQQMQAANSNSRLRANMQTGKRPFVQLRIDP